MRPVGSLSTIGVGEIDVALMADDAGVGHHWHGVGVSSFVTESQGSWIPLGRAMREAKIIPAEITNTTNPKASEAICFMAGLQN